MIYYKVDASSRQEIRKEELGNESQSWAVQDWVAIHLVRQRGN